MKRLIFLLPILGMTMPILGATLPLTSSHFTYEGYFRFPEISEFAGGAYDMTLVADCMGETDPSPSDGYPGCIMTTDVLKGQMSDIVPPTLTGSNTSTAVLLNWDFTGDLPFTVGCDGTGCALGSNELAIYYEQNAAPCRFIWAFYHEYATQPMDDHYFFGTSSCSVSTPNPQGMWRFDIEADVNTGTTDPYRVTKWIYNITRIPSGAATQYFGGDEMLFGPGKCTGSRGSSAGPSFGVRPWTFPTDSNGWDEFVPLFYYNSPSGYPRWYIPTDFQAPISGRDWTLSDSVVGVEVVQIPYGGDVYEAAIFLGSAAIPDATLNPADDPTNKRPDEVETVGILDSMDPPGAQWPLYSTEMNGMIPDMTEVPLVWYGVATFTPGAASQQQPAIADYADPSGCIGLDDPHPCCISAGVGQNCRVPWDTSMISTCSHGTGPSSQHVSSFIWLYDLAELGEMYAGTSGYGPEELMPYEEIDVTFDPGNDGVTAIDTCVQVIRQRGLDYDHTNDWLYSTVETDPSGDNPPYAGGGGRGVAMWSIDVTGGAGPGPSAGPQSVTGGGVSGGKVE